MKRKKKSVKDAKAEKSKPSTVVTTPAKNEDNTRPDFGGLPDRDLKKNLGCG